jgi:hypothetical protein
MPPTALLWWPALMLGGARSSPLQQRHGGSGEGQQDAGTNAPQRGRWLILYSPKVRTLWVCFTGAAAGHRMAAMQRSLSCERGLS